jgi:hypothetical protein
VLGHSWFAWSSWWFGLAATIYIVICERRLVVERRRLRRVAGELEPSVPGSPATLEHPAAHPMHATRDLFDDRLRSVLIQVAVDALPFSLAVDRSRRFSATREDVERAAHTLRTSRLLRFNDPLQDDTKLRLT